MRGFSGADMARARAGGLQAAVLDYRYPRGKEAAMRLEDHLAVAYRLVARQHLREE